MLTLSTRVFLDDNELVLERPFEADGRGWLRQFLAVCDDSSPKRTVDHCTASATVIGN